MIRNPFLWASFVVALGASFALTTATSAEPPEVSYAQAVRPILVQRCFKCHSSTAEEANLRLDSLAAIHRGGTSGPAIVPGDTKASRLVNAIRRSGELKMPPEGPALTANEIAVIESWIAQGAKGSDDELALDHWAFRRPVSHQSPATANSDWNASSIDRFIAHDLEKRGLTPLPAAPSHVWLRRVTLDLTGLPPTPDEISQFAADASPDARERVVERLLSSPRYGERWGRHWMDVWRYSDWDGYGNEIRESQPHIWRWRDWIVDSLNHNKSYDRMVAEMLAGDELAPDDPDTIRATGFLARNWYRFNRNVWLDWTVEHVGKAFQGITYNCARCHDHMYDPMPQTEYYQLRAVFEPHDVRIDPVPGQPNTQADGIARVFDANPAAPTFVFRRGNDKEPDKDHPIAPGLPSFYRHTAWTPESIALPAAVSYPGLQPRVREESRAAAQSRRIAAAASLEKARSRAEMARKQLEEFTRSGTTPAKPLEPVLVEDFASERTEVWRRGPNGEIVFADGRLRLASADLNNAFIEAIKPMPADFTARLKWKTTGGPMWKSVGISWDNHETAANNVYVSAYAGGSKVQVSYRRGGGDQYPPEAAKAMPIELGREYELRIDVAGGLVNVWLDGKFLLAYQIPGDRAKENAVRIWAFNATAELSRFELSPLLDSARLAKAGETAPPTEINVDTLRLAIADAEALAEIEAKGLAVAEAEIESLEARIAADDASFAATPDAGLVAERSTAARAERVHALAKAQRDVFVKTNELATVKRDSKPSDAVSAKKVGEAEAALQKLKETEAAAAKAVDEPATQYGKLTPTYPATSTGRRTALARFLASKENPLTARVAVNHVWLRHFGQPLVETVFDFGKNGKPPSHPELLDTLAVEFMDSGWDLKSLHRAIVLSRVYANASGGNSTASGGNSTASGGNSTASGGSSTASSGDSAAMAKNEAIDPQNRFLWRAQVRRMEAEIVRDSMLAISGSLSSAMHGPDLDPNAGFSLPRRSIYFRTSKEKKMTFLALFDNANPVECYRRAESVAPQQALALVNSELALSQSRLLAASLWKSVSHPEQDDRTTGRFIDRLFVLVLGRDASEAERAACAEFLVDQQKRLSEPSLATFAGPAAAVPPAKDAAARARENLVQVLFNHNDFVSIR